MYFTLTNTRRRSGDNYRSVVRQHVGQYGVVVVRFEDLVENPEAAMRELARQLGTEWHPTLLVPTQLGRPGGANTSFTRNTGIDASAKGKDSDDLVERVQPTGH